MDAATTHMQSDQGWAALGGSPRWRCWMLVSVPCGARGRVQSVRTLSAETHRQAVPCVRVLFPPPAGAVVLMVPSVANRRPHGSAAHRAVAATLSVVVGAFHGQFHAIVLVIEMRTRQWVGGCRGKGWGSYVVNGLQRCGSINASLSARNRGNAEGRRRDSNSGLIACCHDQSSGSSRLGFAAGHRQGSGQAGHQGSGCLQAELINTGRGAGGCVRVNVTSRKRGHRRSRGA